MQWKASICPACALWVCIRQETCGANEHYNQSIIAEEMSELHRWRQQASQWGTCAGSSKQERRGYAACAMLCQH